MSEIIQFPLAQTIICLKIEQQTQHPPLPFTAEVTKMSDIIQNEQMAAQRGHCFHNYNLDHTALAQTGYTYMDESSSAPS